MVDQYDISTLMVDDVMFVVVSNSTSGNETTPNPSMSSSPCYLNAKESSPNIGFDVPT